MADDPIQGPLENLNEINLFNAQRANGNDQPFEQMAMQRQNQALTQQQLADNQRSYQVRLNAIQNGRKAQLLANKQNAAKNAAQAAQDALDAQQHQAGNAQSFWQNLFNSPAHAGMGALGAGLGAGSLMGLMGASGATPVGVGLWGWNPAAMQQYWSGMGNNQFSALGGFGGMNGANLAALMQQGARPSALVMQFPQNQNNPWAT